MQFQKGNKKGRGRPKGVGNKLGQPIRQLLKEIVEGELPRVKKNLRDIEKKSKVQHTELILKLTEYILPKLSRLETKDVNGFEELAELPIEKRRERMKELATFLIKKNNEENTARN